MKALTNIKDIANYQAPVRLGLFLLVLLMLWLPFAALGFLILGSTVSPAFSTALGILLYCFFVALIWFWGRHVEQKAQPYQYYGLVFSSTSGKEWLAGIGLGFLSLGLLMQTQVSLGWLSWQPNTDWVNAILPGSLTGLGVGFAEELLFRGWILTELEKDYGKLRSLWFNSLLFAVLHFIKPLDVILATWVQFPGLVLLGMDLVWARWARGNRLSLAMGLHGGLVWAYYIVNTTHSLKAQQTVPEWVTGIGGNPLAGVMGLLFLGAIAVVIRIFREKRRAQV